MIFSPFGQGRDSALASVEELKPAWREMAASVVPRFLSAAIISAGCQSDFLEIIFNPFSIKLNAVLVV
ncbi:hypothetical protein BBX45_13105 [Proteus mirabilis]|nr:hypothetical protein BBX45_13105 [Proteus mirabilis]